MSYRDAVRAVRLIEIMALLDHRGYTVRELAVRMGVSRFTIWRDLQAIQGEPLYYPLRASDGVYWKMKVRER